MTTWNTSIPNFVAGTVVDEPELDVLSNNLTVIGEAWTSYTPAWTGSGSNPVIGNGTIVGQYRATGKTIDYFINILAGSTTTFGTGTYSFSLPVTAASSVSYHPMGVAIVRDGSAAPLVRFPGHSTTTTVLLIDVAGTIVAATVPFTFANGDRIMLRGSYEAA